MVSTMPKIVYDSLRLVSMVDLPWFHDHSNGDLYEIKGEVKNLQVQFGKRDATVDFFIMESTNQGNIVLGRDILRAMKCFIDICKGQIRLRGKAKGTYLFPRKNKNELIENHFETLGDSDDFGELFDDLDHGSIDTT